MTCWSRHTRNKQKGLTVVDGGTSPPGLSVTLQCPHFQAPKMSTCSVNTCNLHAPPWCLWWGIQKPGTESQAELENLGLCPCRLLACFAFLLVRTMFMISLLLNLPLGHQLGRTVTFTSPSLVTCAVWWAPAWWKVPIARGLPAHAAPFHETQEKALHYPQTHKVLIQCGVAWSFCPLASESVLLRERECGSTDMVEHQALDLTVGSGYAFCAGGRCKKF